MGRGGTGERGEVGRGRGGSGGSGGSEGSGGSGGGRTPDGEDKVKLGRGAVRNSEGLPTSLCYKLTRDTHAKDPI